MDVPNREIRCVNFYPIVAVSIRNPTPTTGWDLDHSDLTCCVNWCLYPVAQSLGAASRLGSGHCDRELDGSGREFQCDVSTGVRWLDVSRIQRSLQSAVKFSCGRTPNSFV